MHNYDEIEKIYYKKKRKKYIITMSLIGITIGAIYLSKPYIQKLFNKEASHKIDQKQQHKNISNITHNKSTTKEKKLILNSQIPKINVETKKKIEIKTTAKPIIKQEIKKTTTTKKEKIKIVVVQKSQKLQDLLNYYKSFKDYNTAIEIANIYYKNKDYQNSITWAKKANDLNAKDEQSWLIYAKSLVQLHKTIKAKTLLKLYLEIYGPNKSISSYLRSIK